MPPTKPARLIGAVPCEKGAPVTVTWNESVEWRLSLAQDSVTVEMRTNVCSTRHDTKTQLRSHIKKNCVLSHSRARLFMVKWLRTTTCIS